MSTPEAAAPIRLLDGGVVDELATVELGLEAAHAAALLDRSQVVTGRVQVNGPVSWMRIMGGNVTELDLTGYKEFHRVGQRVRYHVSLFRESTADALGIVDGRRITSLRTSSTAAVAVRHWAQGRSVRVGLIGSGEEAREGLRALHGAVDVVRAVVFSPTPANREAFAASMTEKLGIEVTAVASAQEVADDCDVLYVATSSHHEAFLHKADVENVPMIAAIGSTMPAHRELFGDVFTDATVVVDTLDALHESGDCIEAVAEGWDPRTAVELSTYLGAEPSASRRTVFKSIGSVEQDLVLAHHLLQAAQKLDRGVITDPIGSLRVMR